ncbi:MAG: crosslink repair DNA glycosylase YcaQ family protein [Planctomycetota bacterium]
MKENTISLKSVRRIALHAQLLDGDTRLYKGKRGVLQAIETLGYIQIDTLAVIERAHHHTLRTRLVDYDPKSLDALQVKDRKVFEYWGHALSILPMSEYRYYQARMRGFLNPSDKWDKDRLEQFGHLMKPALARIRNEGPLSAKDFDPSSDDKSYTRQVGNPYKIALELLFNAGDLMITERRKFQRVYDLTERVLPEGVDTTPPDPDELGRFLVRRALSAYGVADEMEICRHINAAPKKVILTSLAALVGDGEVTPVSIEKEQSRCNYALRKTLDKAARLKPLREEIFLLSPFDNLIIQRERMKRLFGFDYTIECYVPPAKRKYGYYCLPVLWGDELVARLDPKVEREAKTFVMRNLVFEQGFKSYDTFLPAFAQKLREFSRTYGCDRIEINKISPAKIKAELKRLVSFGGGVEP